MYLQSSEQFVKVDDLSILDIVVSVCLSVCLSVCILFFFMSTWVVNKRMYVFLIKYVHIQFPLLRNKTVCLTEAYYSHKKWLWISFP